MSYTPVFAGIAKNGKFVPEKPAEMQEYLRSVDGKQLFVHYKRRSKLHSQQQGRYYWGVVLKTICQYTGYEIDELHEIFKYRFLRQEDNSAIGCRIPSTSTLSAGEYCEYLSRVITFASTDLGCVIPGPDDVVVVK
jgi:hypothetical protein